MGSKHETSPMVQESESYGTNSPAASSNYQNAHAVVADEEEDLELEYKDFNNIQDMIHEFFHPLRQNKEVLSGKYCPPHMMKKKTMRGSAKNLT